MTKKVRSHDDGVRLAQYRDAFEHPSVFGQWRICWRAADPAVEKVKPPEVYVIYSYGFHFPMYVYDETTQQWLGNSSKYSRTTSSHQSKYRPSVVAKWFDTTTLEDIVRHGYVGYITNRMENGLPE
jgi:hypothetical protein